MVIKNIYVKNNVENYNKYSMKDNRFYYLIVSGAKKWKYKKFIYKFKNTYLKVSLFF